MKIDTKSNYNLLYQTLYVYIIFYLIHSADFLPSLSLSILSAYHVSGGTGGPGDTAVKKTQKLNLRKLSNLPKVFIESMFQYLW